MTTIKNVTEKKEKKKKLKSLIRFHSANKIDSYNEVKSLSRVRLFATPWTVAYQAPLSMGFSKQEYWSGLPFPSGDLPDPGIELRSPALQADALPSEPPGKTITIAGDKKGKKEKRKNIQKNLQNKSKHKNNKCFS